MNPNPFVLTAWTDGTDGLPAGVYRLHPTPDMPHEVRVQAEPLLSALFLSWAAVPNYGVAPDHIQAIVTDLLALGALCADPVLHPDTGGPH